MNDGFICFSDNEHTPRLGLILTIPGTAKNSKHEEAITLMYASGMVGEKAFTITRKAYFRILITRKSIMYLHKKSISQMSLLTVTYLGI